MLRKTFEQPAATIMTKIRCKALIILEVLTSPLRPKLVKYHQGKDHFHELKE